MYVIEVVLRVDPVAAAIVDLEGQVGRFGFGLDGREIGADDAGVWVFFREVAVAVLCKL